MILPSLVTEFNEIVHNSRKNQSYTYLACENRPLCFYTYCDSYATQDLILRKKFSFRNL